MPNCRAELLPPRCSQTGHCSRVLPAPHSCWVCDLIVSPGRFLVLV